MSIAKNIAGTFMPHTESRRSSTTLAALNAELVHNVDGDESVTININASSVLTATYTIEGTVDGTNYFSLMLYPYTSTGGTLPYPGQPIFTEVVTTVITRVLCAGVGGLQKVRVRFSSWTSGSAVININSDSCASLNPFVRDQKTSTLMVTTTAAAGTALSVTMPAVTGLRHYIDSIEVTRSATAALTAAATPVVVTTTAMIGSPQFTFGQDAGGIGLDIVKKLDFGSNGLPSTAINNATTVVAPAYVGVVWRITVVYRLGL